MTSNGDRQQQPFLLGARGDIPEPESLPNPKSFFSGKILGGKTSEVGATRLMSRLMRRLDHLEPC